MSITVYLAMFFWLKLVKNESFMFKNHTICRVCGSSKLTEYLDLGLMPLSNNLLTDPEEVAPRYPLKVLLCEDCGLSQLSIVIDPVTLFGHYVYRSSISKGYRDHCFNMALTLKDRYNLTDESFHIDIAGNDGALLAEFKRALGHKTLNVDPAANLAAYNEDRGIRYFKTFWGLEAARHLRATGWPEASLITATNVFAHVDDVAVFLEAAKLALKDTGVIVLEFPYLIDFMVKREFDTVYFEHLSYFSIGPLLKVCARAGLHLENVEHFSIHGGSVRAYIRKLPVPPSTAVGHFVAHEIDGGFTSIDTYKQWAADVSDVLKNFYSLLSDLSASGAKVYGFAASAKGNTLLNACSITRAEIPYLIDETPEKKGKYSPGTGIPIVGIEQLSEDPPDFLVLLAWNFATEIVLKCQKLGYKGKFILPLTCEII